MAALLTGQSVRQLAAVLESRKLHRFILSSQSRTVHHPHRRLFDCSPLRSVPTLLVLQSK